MLSQAECGNQDFLVPRNKHVWKVDVEEALVQTGSFTAAAARLGITKAVVCQQVARLEQELRTSLLVRTTRKVQASEAARSFYQRCTMILRDADDAFHELADTSSEPSGMLRLTAAFDYGVGVVVPAIAAFTRRYPACKVDAILTDQSLDMMSGSIELAIRVGWLAETGLQARQIGTFQQLLVASPTSASTGSGHRTGESRLRRASICRRRPRSAFDCASPRLRE